MKIWASLSEYNRSLPFSFTPSSHHSKQRALFVGSLTTFIHILLLLHLKLNPHFFIHCFRTRSYIYTHVTLTFRPSNFWYQTSARWHHNGGGWNWRVSQWLNKQPFVYEWKLASDKLPSHHNCMTNDLVQIQVWFRDNQTSI